MLLEHGVGNAGRELALGLVDRNRKLLQQASRHPFKIVGESSQELATHVFLPPNWAAADRRAAILFFHSSEWDHGNITQFAPHGLFLASRGAVCFLVEYRMGAADGRAPLEAMADARSAVRWVRLNREALGIDPAMVVAAGGSCGGHAAVTAAMCAADFDDPDDQLETSCLPDAVVLFSPVLDISKKGFGLAAFADAATAAKANPLKCVRSHLPPMLIFHGGADARVPVRGSQRFAKKMRAKKNVCELIEFGGQPHSFFNLNVNEGHYYATVDATDAFLVSLGFLDAGEAEGP